VKWAIRTGNTGDVVGAIVQDRDMVETEQYLALFETASQQLLGRLQVVSNAYVVGTNSGYMTGLYEEGRYLPFWLEGLHGIVWDRLNQQRRYMAGVYLTEFSNFGGQNLGSWIASIGLVGWFFIVGDSIPYFIVYVFGILFLSVYLVKLAGQSTLRSDLLWYSWLVYVIPGWFGAFITLMHALVIFILLKVFLHKLIAVFGYEFQFVGVE
jgi:hypothetical protein